MKKIVIGLSLILFMVFCKKLNQKELENNCVSKLFNDSILISKNQDSLIIIKNITNNKKDSLVSQTSNCLQPILSNDNNLYTLISDELFQCIDIKTKIVKWNFKPPEQINNFKLFDNNLIFSVRDYGLIILDSETGKTKYELKSSHLSECHSMLINDFLVKNNYLYVSDFRCNNLVCFDLKNGKEVWNYKFKIEGATQFLLINDFVFCGITGNPVKKEGSIVLLDRLSGEVKFEKDEQFDLITKPIVFKNKVIYYSYNSKIIEFDVENFKSKKIVHFDDSNGICDGQIYLLDDNIYFIDCNFQIKKFDLNLNKLYKLGKAPKSLTTIYKINNEVKLIY
jgi:hypothetical protein